MVTLVHLPLGKTVKLSYNGGGNITSKLDEDGLETLYEYNLAGKLAQIAYADGKTVKLSYNLLGQLTQMQDWLGTTTIEMDELGRTKKVVDFEGKAVGYEWNALGQREKTIYPDESDVLYQYNASGKLSGVQSAGGSTQYRYDPMGRLAQRILPDNTTTSYEFNPLGKITSLTHEQGGKALDEFRYHYDPVGNITQIEKQRTGMEADSGLFQYTYDPLGRLVEAVHGEQSKRYNYDSLGNRISTVQDGKVVQHAYNARNQLVQTEQGKMVQDYYYDGRGNLTHSYENGQLKAKYTYDATNMMVGAFTEGKGTAEYSYNGLRNRVKKLENLHNLGDLPDPRKELHYTLDLILPYNNLLATEGAQNQNFIWGNDLIETEGEDNYYYLQDHLGSPTRLLDGQGTGTALAYDEFGVPLAGTGKNSNPFGFTGYQADEVAGLYYAQARYYDAGLGRFGAVDTHWNADNRIYGDMPKNINKHKADGHLLDMRTSTCFPDIAAMTQSKNLYDYCINSPLIYVDFNGKSAAAIMGSSWGIAGGAALLDGPLPIGDVVGLVIGIGGTIVAGGVMIGNILVESRPTSESLPYTGEPNTSKDLLNPDGSVKQRRYYGPDGQPLRDRDYNHPGEDHVFPHDHWWENGKRQKGVPVPERDDSLDGSDFDDTFLEPMKIMTVLSVVTAMLVMLSPIGQSKSCPE